MLMNKTLQIEKIFQETPDVRTLRLKLEESLDYKPGQFLMIGKDMMYNGEIKKIKRAFSISSSPLIKDYLEITVKKENNGLFTPIIFTLKEGDFLEISGPFGMFVYQNEIKEKYDEIFLIAGGTGIAPLRGIFNHILFNNIQINITLLYSVKTPEYIIYRKELENLKKKYKNFNVVITITRPEESKEKWDGLKGRIDKKIINEKIKDLEKTIFFICGPPDMVTTTVKYLKELNIKNEQIKIEKW